MKLTQLFSTTMDLILNLNVVDIPVSPDQPTEELDIDIQCAFSPNQKHYLPIVSVTIKSLYATG